MIFCQNAPTPTTSVTVLFGKKGFVPPKLDANFPNWDHCTALHHCTHCTSLQRIESNDKARPLDKTPLWYVKFVEPTPKGPSEEAKMQTVNVSYLLGKFCKFCTIVTTHTQSHVRQTKSIHQTPILQVRCRPAAGAGHRRV